MDTLDLQSIENIDFGDIAKELDLLERENPNCEILSVLKEGKPLDSYKKALAEDLHRLETVVVESYLHNSDSLLDLYHETRKCDEILAGMEGVLSEFSDNLRGVSDEIRQLQFKSQELSAQLRVQNESQSKVTDFLNAVIVSPDIVATIFEEEDCGSDRFISAISVLSKQIQSHQNLAPNLPAVAESGPELTRLKHKANGKIREFLIVKINSLKKPGTNVQMIQKNVLVKARKLMRFLKVSEPLLFKEVAAYYTATITKVYSNQFKQYVHALSKLSLETTANSKSDLIGSESLGIAGHSTSLTGVASDLMKLKLPSSASNSFSSSSPPQAGENLFSLENREKILTDVDSAEAIVVAVTDVPSNAAQKFFPESLLRSHQKLLCDTATSEYLFLLDFFDLHRPQSPSSDPADRIEKYFEGIFGGKILPWISDHVIGVSGPVVGAASPLSVRESFDTVGLLLQLRVLEQFQDTMINKRKIPVLDSYFEHLISQIRQRARFLVDLNGDSLKRIDAKKISPLSPQTVTVFTKRFGEYMAAILSANAQWLPLATLASLFHNFLASVAKRLTSGSEIFLINNYDCVLGILRARGVGDATAGFKEWADKVALLENQLVEKKLGEQFAAMIKLVIDSEKLMAGSGALSPRAASLSTAQSQEFERCVLSFQSNWKSGLEKIKSEIFDPSLFANSAIGREIFKATTTQFLLYHTRFQRVVTARTASLAGGASWTKQMVPSAVLMAEVKTLLATLPV